MIYKYVMYWVGLSLLLQHQFFFKNDWQKLSLYCETNFSLPPGQTSSINISNQWQGDWEIYDETGNYQFLLSLSDTAAISDFYCLQNCSRNYPDYYEHQTKNCFVNSPFQGFCCIQKVNEETLWLEQFKNRDTKSPEYLYGLRVDYLKPKHFNYDETLVQIELPEAGETMELLMAGNRFSNILIGPAKNESAKVRIQANDVLIKKQELSLFLQQEMDKLEIGAKQLIIHLRADRSVSEQELRILFKNTNLEKHELYRVYLDQKKQRVGIKLMKF